MQSPLSCSVLTALLIALIPATSGAAGSAAFSDVPPSSPHFQAVEYLKEKGILRGYDDGTFRPGDRIGRAESLKVILAPLLSTPETVHSPFSDVPDGAWFAPFVEYARTNGIVAGPPERTAFRPADPVKEAEFLKMFFLAQGVQPSTAFSDLPLPLASDVHPADWYFPLLRYALASSMIMVDAGGHLSPGAELTRGDVALLLHRFFMYKEGRRTQALLSEAESEVMSAVRMMDQKQVEQAEYASARSLVAARGALAGNPESAVVKGAVKITEGFHSIIQAYRAGTEGRLDDVISRSKEAWATAQRAREFSPSLEKLSAQMQSIAKGMADDARELKGRAS
ncbi:MAG: S-layer homology domain-containing protein [Patescibacteria group bacterium]